MFRKLKEGNRYNFQSTHFIITNQELSENELKLLDQLLTSFGLFKDTFPKKIADHISNFLSVEDNMKIALTRKDAYIIAEVEKRLTMK
jgi:hypothetical protein